MDVNLQCLACLFCFSMRFLGAWKRLYLRIFLGVWRRLYLRIFLGAYRHLYLSIFLGAKKRLYKGLRRLVGWSVRPLVGPSVRTLDKVIPLFTLF
jgi:hypothetical protein